MVMVHMGLPYNSMDNVVRVLRERTNPEYINDEKYLGDDEDIVSLYDDLALISRVSEEMYYTVLVTPYQYTVIAEILRETP